ncbi:MAG: hypothetical protein K9L75_00200 [Spirochaetia bacterium]|nr:hypothetical protein [Spirochaetia bacterium]
MKKFFFLLYILCFPLVFPLETPKSLNIPYTEIELNTAETAEFEFLSELLAISNGNDAESISDFFKLNTNRSNLSGSAADNMSLEKIQIYEADSITYFTYREKDIISIQGNVSLEVFNGDARKIFYARNILFNQTDSTIIALGQVDIKTDSSSDKNNTNNKNDNIIVPFEKMESEILFLKLNDSSGISFNTKTSFSTIIDEEEKTLYIDGGKISLNEDSTIIIEPGVISTQKDDSYVRIKAKKIKLLQDGDWSIHNAVLFIGNIPVFYTPFFFYPGKRLLFNPVVGIDDEKGFFIQNTLYFQGKPELKDSDSTNFLQFSQNGENVGIKKNIFSFAYDTDIDAETKVDNKDYSKIFADFYSIPEFLLGFEGSYKKIGNFEDNLIKGGITVGEDRALIGNSLQPFGYYADINSSLKTENIDIKIHFPYYSEIHLAEDVLNRFENFKINYLFDEIDWETEYSTLYNLKWLINSSFDPINFGKNSSQTFTIRTASAYLLWNSNNENADIRTFKPYKLVLPNLKYTLKGNLLSYTAAEQENKTERSSFDTNLLKIDPLFNSETSTDNTAEQHSSGENIVTSMNAEGYPQVNLDYAPMQDRLPDFSKNKYASQNKFSIDYSLDHDINMYSLLEEDPAYYYFHSGLDGTISSEGNLFNNNILFKFENSQEWNVKQIFETDSFNTDNGNNEIESTYIASSSDVTVNVPKIHLDYYFTADLYENYYLDDETEEKKFIWNDEFVLTHKVKADYEFELINKKFSLTPFISFDLPPLVSKINSGFSVDGLYFNFDAETSYNHDEDTDSWNLEPFNIDISSQNLKNVSFKNSLNFDIYNDSFENDTSLDIKFLNDDLRLFQKAKLQKHPDQNALIELYDISLSYINSSLSLRNRIVEDSVENSLEIKNIIFDSTLNLPIETFSNEKYALDASFDTLWNIDLFEENTDLNFSANINFEIKDLLEISFTSLSRNKNTYNYFFNEDDKSSVSFFLKQFFTNLLKSFNFLDEQDRRESDFNIDSLSLEVVHKMPDWDFHFMYTGELSLNNNTWEWDPAASIYLEWKIAPEIKLDKDIQVN